MPVWVGSAEAQKLVEQPFQAEAQCSLLSVCSPRPSQQAVAAHDKLCLASRPCLNGSVLRRPRCLHLLMPVVMGGQHTSLALGSLDRAVRMRPIWM